MVNLDDLTTKINKILTEEKQQNPDIRHLTSAHSRLLAQIVSNYNLENRFMAFQDKPKAEMLFVGAPTGAGKDTLVRKIMIDNPDKQYVVLNMDMFRYYHESITGMPEDITDKDFAMKTNQTSYELYYMIQEIILKEYPGTNVIITGTMKDLDWINEIVDRYKNDPKTDYTTSLHTLAVPINESAFSIFERYLNLVASRNGFTFPLRYTDLGYHNATIKDFINNVAHFEKELEENPRTSKFSSIRVYRRNKDMYDLSEDTLIYDSNNKKEGQTAVQSISQTMYSPHVIENERIIKLLDIIKNNKDYIKSQGLYKDILKDLQTILPQLRKSPGNSEVSSIEDDFDEK